MKASVLIFRFVFTLEERNIFFLFTLFHHFFQFELSSQISLIERLRMSFLCVIGFDFSASNLPPLNATDMRNTAVK